MTEEPTMALVTLSYSNILIMPLDNAIKLMATLNNVESVDTTDYKNHKVIPYKGEISLSILSNFAYKEMKVNTLLEPPEEK